MTTFKTSKTGITLLKVANKLVSYTQALVSFQKYMPPPLLYLRKRKRRGHIYFE
jgi:hypothetical protein